MRNYHFTRRQYEIHQLRLTEQTRENADARARTFSWNDAEKLRESIKRNPQAPASVHLAQYRLPFETQDQIGKAVGGLMLKNERRKDDDGGGLFSRIKDIGTDSLKTTARYALPILDFGPQVVQGEFRNAVNTTTDQFNALREGDLGEVVSRGWQGSGESLLNPGFLGRRAIDTAIDGGDGDFFRQGDVLSQTSVGQMGYSVQEASQAARRDGRLIDLEEIDDDMGDGWFISRESEMEKRRIRAERMRGTLADGRTISLGRQAADWIHFDPEVKGVNLVSGFLDGAVALRTPSFDIFIDEGVDAGRTALRRAGGGTSISDFTKQMPVPVSATGGSWRDNAANLARYGVHRGTVTQIDPIKTTQLFDSEAGRRMTQRLADMAGEKDSWANIWRTMGRKYDPALVTRLADAKNADEVRSILVEGIAGNMYPQVRTNLGNRFASVTDNMRLTGQMPDQFLDLKDGAQSTNWVQDFAQNVKAPEWMRNEWLDQMGRATGQEARRRAYHRVLSDTMFDILEGSTPDIAFSARNIDDSMKWVDELATELDAGDELADAWRGLMRDAPDESRRISAHHEILREARGKNLLPGTFSPEQAAEFTKYMGWSANQSYIDFTEQLAMDRTNWDIIQAGDTRHRLPSVMLLDQMATRLPTPDLRQLRQATSKTRGLFFHLEDADGYRRIANVIGRSGPGQVIDVTSRVMHLVFGRVWKDTRLFRLAYPIRVVGEEQVRMAAAGYDSMFRHPISYISDLMTHKSTDDILGSLLSDSEAFRAARTGSDLGGLRNITRGRAPIHQQMVEKANPEQRADYVKAWKDELATFGSDPIMRRVAEAESLDDVSRWLGVGEIPPPVTSAVDLTDPNRFGAGARFRDDLLDAKPELADPGEMDRYLKSLSEWIESSTGGNNNLRQAIGRGGTDFKLRVDPDTKKVLARPMDLDDLVDEFGPSTLVYRFKGKGPNRLESGYDKATERIFEYLGAKPTNGLSRSPLFRQAYAENLMELAPLVDDADAFVEMAARAGLDDGQFQLIRNTAGSAGSGRLSSEMVDDLAKTGALDKVQDLLYDVSRRGQFFDTYRLLFPFGEAWKEVMTTWAGLAAKSPARLSWRALQTAEATRDAGVFHENRDGDLVFTYPGSSFLTNVYAGVPVDIEGRVSGLNLMGQVTPGLGPTAQIPAWKLLPESTGYDTVRDLLFPFGDPGDPRDIRKYVFPQWFNTMLNRDGGLTPEDKRLYGNTVFRTAQQLASTGDYDLSTQAGINQLRVDAERAASRLVMIRGAFQTSAPSAPQLNPQIYKEMGDGNTALIDLHVAQNAYQKYLDLNPERAAEMFLNEFGMENLLLMGSNTAPTVHGGVPMTGDGYDWVRDHGEQVEKHPQLYGYFAPYDPAGDFNFAAYRRAIESGELEVLDFDEKVALAQHGYAANIYRRTRNDLLDQNEAVGRKSLTDEQRIRMRLVKEKLSEEFPGYNNVDSIGTKSEVKDVIASGSVEEALADPVLRETEVGEALAHYWEVRDVAITAYKQMTDQSGTWQAGADAEPIRFALRTVGDELAVDYPAFRRMWDDFLSREFEENDDG